MRCALLQQSDLCRICSFCGFVIVDDVGINVDDDDVVVIFPVVLISGVAAIFVSVIHVSDF